jgi:hypothetical protein
VKLLRAVSNFLEAKDIDLEKFIGGLQNKDGKPMPNVMTWDANLDEYVFDSENISHEDLIRIIAKANEYFGEPTAVQENLETSLQTYADTLQANFHARIEFEIGKADSIVEGFQSRMDNTIRQSFFERVKKSFSEVFKSAWESLKTGLKEVVDVIVQQFEGLSEVANEVFYNMNGRPRPKSEAGSELEDLDTGLVVEETQAPEPVQTAAQRETTRSEGAGVIPISTSSESDSMFDALTSRDSGEVMGIAGSPSAPEGQDTVAQPLALSTENAYESEDVINFS